MLIAGYASARELLREEIAELEYEGFVIPERVREAFAMLHPEADACNESAIRKIYRLLDGASRRPDWEWVEPDDLEAIRRERPSGPRRFETAFSDEELLDRYYGAWQGRSVGCALGKPVECMGMNGRQWRDIRDYLMRRGDWPLRDYFSGRGAREGELSCPLSQRENIRFMESDDDIRYTLLGLLVVERYGAAFDWREIAGLWNRLLPMELVCTAERQALLNYNLRRPETLTREFTRRHNNPCRQWIGAQIRADFWGWCCAGNPERAAEFAWRDASWTHVANGIYGEMFIAALQAAAFVESDPERLIEIGLSEIPARCRLAAAVREGVAKAKELPDLESFMEWFEQRYAGLSAVHTVNNAVLCAMALLRGGMNPDRSVCLAVSGGLDTDCNGATVGAVTGIVAGKSGFGGTLAGRLNGTIRAAFGEFVEISMESLAERTLKARRRIESAL